MIRAVIRKLFGDELYGKCKRLLKIEERRRMNLPVFTYDRDRYCTFGGLRSNRRAESLRAEIIMAYHVVEKSLTMPERRNWFGKNQISNLMSLLSEYEKKYGLDDLQVRHAVAVLKEYVALHEKLPCSETDEIYWKTLKAFVGRYPSIECSKQRHVSRDEFFSFVNAPFPVFAHARSTVRNYTSECVSIQTIRDAVELAITAPSACNRQHCRVYCVTNTKALTRVLSLQGGNRGFGHLSNCLLIVTGDLYDTYGANERNDVYVNGGMFLMNLCYSLFYYKVASCVLTWAQSPATDVSLRSIVSIPPSESVVAMVACGVAPDSFDVAISPRKSVDEVFVVL